MSEHKGVLVYGETAEGKISKITTEILGAGRRIADCYMEDLICVFIGHDLGGIPQTAIVFGADKVYVVEDLKFKDYQADFCVQAMGKILKEISPRVLLFGQTTIGCDLAPRIAFRFRTGLSMDCIELNINSVTKALEQTRPVYGGNVLALLTTETFPQTATIRSRVMSPLEPDETRKGDVIPLNVKLDVEQIKMNLIETIKQEAPGIRLDDAEVVVTGGRGIGGPEGFKQLDELARTLKGAVGATRPACDSAWVATSMQIGLTGKIVSPRLYIAVAVSGASQHMTGCLGAKTIIAINKDEGASIFDKAHFGIVGDWRQVLPAFTEMVKQLISGS